jgi:hypothetical protein
MNLYQGYFVPGGVDPWGLTTCDVICNKIEFESTGTNLDRYQTCLRACKLWFGDNAYNGTIECEQAETFKEKMNKMDLFVEPLITALQSDPSLIEDPEIKSLVKKLKEERAWSKDAISELKAAIVMAGVEVVISAGIGTAVAIVAEAIADARATNKARKLAANSRKLAANRAVTGPYVGGRLAGSMDDVAARQWYHQQLDGIAGQIDRTQSLRNQAMQAFDLRNQARIDARALMSDRAKAAALDVSDPIRSWQDMLKYQAGKGHEGSAIYQAILDSAARSRPTVDAALGLSR